MKGRKASESPMKGNWDKDAAPSDVYAGGSSNVAKEAKQRKHGGKAKHVGKAEGKMVAHRGDRKPRKTGGRAGSNMNPLSSAASGTQPKGHKSYVS